MKGSRLVPVLAGACFAMSFSGLCEASIIYFDPEPDIPIPTDLAGLSLDLETGVLGEAAGADVNFFLGGFGITNDAYASMTSPTFQPVRTGTGNLDTVANLALGTIIDGTSTFSSGFGGSGDPNAHVGSTFTDGVPGYIGFSLESGGSTLYGWMHVTLTTNTSGGFIHEWAFETVDGAPIAVGAVPEASQAAIFMLGLFGIAVHRRRRRVTA